jgi:hypothetical protein
VCPSFLGQYQRLTATCPLARHVVKYVQSRAARLSSWQPALPLRYSRDAEHAPTRTLVRTAGLFSSFRQHMPVSQFGQKRPET